MEEIHKKVKIAHVFYSMMIRMMIMFGVVFFYLIFDKSIAFTFSFFGIVYLVSGVLDTQVPKVIRKIGINKSAAIGMVSFLLSFISLVLLESNAESKLLLVLYACFYILGRIFYANSFQIYFSYTLPIKKVGSDLGGFIAIIGLGSALLPALTGYLSDILGVLALLIMATLFCVTSAFLYLKIPKIDFTYDLKFSHIFKDRVYRNTLMVSFWDAVYNSNKFLWGIWLFLSLEEKFRLTGIFIAGINLVAVLGAKLLGNFLDGKNKRSVYTFFRFTNAFEFILKAFAFNKIFLTVGDLLGRLNSELYGTSQDVFYFSWLDHHEQHELVDEREVAGQFIYNLIMGVAFLSFGFLSIYFSIPHIFGILGVVYLIGSILYLKKKINE